MNEASILPKVASNYLIKQDPLGNALSYVHNLWKWIKYAQARYVYTTRRIFTELDFH